MAYYAHSSSGRLESQWELISVHLNEVAALAADSGARFGASDLAGAAGALHDLGKYSAAFQERLRNPAVTTDHSTAGAIWARAHLGDKWGRLLAHVIAGHHTGLKDGLFDPEGRLASKSGLLPPVERAAKSDGLVLPQGAMTPVGRLKVLNEEGFQFAFLTRMIFSCLVDADRRCAAAFEARMGGQPTEETNHPSIDVLALALSAFMAQRKAEPSTLNTLRGDVLRAAIATAEQAQGVFTLTVPTGGGKTLSSLAFALAHARKHGLDRVIVVIPYTSIIEQTAAVYRAALKDHEGAVLEHHSAFEMEEEATWSRDRIGPDRLRLSMERWDSPIIVTTAVQFFESLFSDRTSRCRKLHSIARSVVVLDEAQTMPLPLLRPCVAALKELARNYRTSVVLCTATQPALKAGPPGTKTGFVGGFTTLREIAPDVPSLFAALRRVTVRDIGVQTDDQLAARIATSPQALCIVNQRAHARALFGAIRDLPGARHLSTTMHSVHRARVLAEIRDDLKNKRACRVVATSLVEAGVDVDFPLVLRATAGLDQIAQAAGRCNREFERRPEESEVLVFKAAAYDVIQQLKINAEVGGEILTLHAGDPFSPDAMRAFFEMLYWRRGKEDLDKGRVLQTCADKAADLNFPFQEIAASMRFIDDVMVPVIVAAEDNGEVRPLIEALRYTTRVGGIARKLGRYTVGVPRPVRSAMYAAGVAERIRPEEFEDQFVILLNLELYKADAGLDWNDLTFRTAESLMG
ncbi:CRISPR-associated endonuclease Cas3'' [Acidisoma cladoniae]|uniref:CRISPR-associated endonuclease Cas3'' n=1 Tax=Acidisoma cladoniae TaxID=3040935 RepID=UPI00254EA22C|nr:CRISPR-associated endonuclease Cas3'' [Acidisoma sp. PAMC 29798]